MKAYVQTVKSGKKRVPVMDVDNEGNLVHRTYVTKSGQVKKKYEKNPLPIREIGTIRHAGIPKFVAPVAPTEEEIEANERLIEEDYEPEIDPASYDYPQQ